MLKTKYLFLFALLLALYSCKISKDSNGTFYDTENDFIDKSVLNIIFINFKISKDSLQLNSDVTISGVQITDGELKKGTFPATSNVTYENEIRCAFEDENNNALYETTIEHPLFKKFEYTNDDGKFAVKEVILEEAVFSLRAKYQENMKYIRVIEKLKGLKEVEIAKLEIKI